MVSMPELLHIVLLNNQKAKSLKSTNLLTYTEWYIIAKTQQHSAVYTFSRITNWLAIYIDHMFSYIRIYSCDPYQWCLIKLLSIMWTFACYLRWLSAYPYTCHTASRKYWLLLSPYLWALFRFPLQNAYLNEKLLQAGFDDRKVRNRGYNPDFLKLPLSSTVCVLHLDIKIAVGKCVLFSNRIQLYRFLKQKARSGHGFDPEICQRMHTVLETFIPRITGPG